MRTASMNRRSFRASLRPEPGSVSTPVDTSTPHGPTRRIAEATFSALSPPASSRRTPGGHRVGERPVEHGARTGLVGVDQHDVDRPVRDRGDRGITGGETLDHERHPLADPPDVGERLATMQLRAAEAEGVDQLDDALSSFVAEHPHRDHARRQAMEDLPTVSGTTLRALPGANTNPSASAPSATASRASSSLVMPHTFTHIDAPRVPDAFRTAAYIRGPMDAVAAPRSWAGFVRDWLPLALILVSYLILHELADTLSPGAHVLPQLGFDEHLMGGNAPTVQLQRALWDGSHVHWYDYLTWLVYLSHFVVTFTVAVVLWVRAYPLFRRLRALVVMVTFAGFATYILYPAIPPWLASARGDMPHTVRVVREVWRHLGMSDVAAVFGEKSKYAFPVGALPSLHAAWPFLLMLLFWSPRRAVAHPARGLRAGDVVHARVHRRPLRVRHPPRLDVQQRGVRRHRSRVDEPAVEEVVVGREVEQPVT